MANVSAELIWGLTQNHNAFLIKQGSGRIQLSREKGNLLNKNSFRCSGLANSKAVHIGAPNGLETPFAVKSGNKFQNSVLKSKIANEGVKSQGKAKKGGAKQATNTVSRQNSVTHNGRHLKQIAKACSTVGRRDLQANALARYSKIHAALLNINKPVAAAASLRGKRGLGVAPGVFRVRLDISEKAKRIHKKHEAIAAKASK